MLTTKEILEQTKLELEILRAELDSFLQGEWKHEYNMTIGYNKVFTGRKIYKEQ